MRLFVQGTARRDIREQRTYYLEQGAPAIAVRFVLAIERTIEIILAMP